MSSLGEQCPECKTVGRWALIPTIFVHDDPLEQEMCPTAQPGYKR